jgi:hypothetical protein
VGTRAKKDRRLLRRLGEERIALALKERNPFKVRALLNPMRDALRRTEPEMLDMFERALKKLEA